MSGQVAYEEEGSRVKPIDAFGEELGIKEASTRLVFNHLNSFADHKVIRQRHQVSIFFLKKQQVKHDFYCKVSMVLKCTSSFSFF